jgi:hypothetical protein
MRTTRGRARPLGVTLLLIYLALLGLATFGPHTHAQAAGPEQHCAYAGQGARLAAAETAEPHQTHLCAACTWLRTASAPVPEPPRAAAPIAATPVLPVRPDSGPRPGADFPLSSRGPPAS